MACDICLQFYKVFFAIKLHFKANSNANTVAKIEILKNAEDFVGLQNLRFQNGH